MHSLRHVLRWHRTNTTNSKSQRWDAILAASCQETTINTFRQAKNFLELFQMLEAKQILWGSQKRYTSKELKILINRVRTQNPLLHLPLNILPETGGLRQRVRELWNAESR